MWSKTNLMGHGSSSRSATSANGAASEPVMRARYCRACGQKYFRIRQRLGRPCGIGLGFNISCQKKKQKSEKLKAEMLPLFYSPFSILLRRACNLSRSRGRPSPRRGESASARERAQSAGRLARPAEAQVHEHTFQQTVVRLSQRRADRAPQAGRAERIGPEHSQQSEPLEGRRTQPLLGTGLDARYAYDRNAFGNRLADRVIAAHANERVHRREQPGEMLHESTEFDAVFGGQPFERVALIVRRHRPGNHEAL